MKKTSRPWVVGLAWAMSPVVAVWAQSTPSLDTVVITAQPASPIAGAASESLSGDALVLRRGATLAETLAGVPGVAQSWFGPNANRPALRGQDGDRVKTLSNAGASLDAASLSADHAVPVDPLVADRIEVLRGPNALRYGSNSIGGVINSSDQRIPHEVAEGFSGRAEMRLGGATQERAGVAVLEQGSEHWALHVDAMRRVTDDLQVPRFNPPPGTASTERVVNAASNSQGGSVGGSWLGEHHWLGLSVDQWESRYGTVVEPDVTIHMQRTSSALAGEWREVFPVVDKIRARLDESHYQHEEIAGANVGTVFHNAGHAGRIEVEHRPLFAGAEGVLGVQWESSAFSALGSEAFVPSTQSKQQALFMVERLPTAGGLWSAGLRVEQAQIASDGDQGLTVGRFGSASERRFELLSASLERTDKLWSGWQSRLELAHSERAPTHAELFANGVHVATAMFERGDSQLPKEQGGHVSAALEQRSRDASIKLGLWHSAFANYLVLGATGRSVLLVNANGLSYSLPESAFSAVSAQLSGVELSGHRRVRFGGLALDTEACAEGLRGLNLSDGQPLPRLAPWHGNVATVLSASVWSARLELDWAARQTQVPQDDTATPGHGLLHVGFTRRFETSSAGTGLFFLRLNNLGNVLAWNAASVPAVRSLAPLPGRSLAVGMRVSL
ncbi:MAG: TonB-dependent receptor [Leptothrix ochracea]|uniref:TonB-dependent receptor n=1 Tax=Leptothrix ochracea TaxID=735331 RepID=UPI0034E2020E